MFFYNALGRSRGGFSTKLSLVTDGRGLGLAVAVHAGQASDLRAVPALLDSVAIPGPRGAPGCSAPPRRRTPRSNHGGRDFHTIAGRGFQTSVDTASIRASHPSSAEARSRRPSGASGERFSR